MKRHAAGCIAMTVLYVVVAVVGYRLVPELEATARVGLALLSSIFSTLGLLSFWSLAMGHGRGERSLAAMIRRARSGEPPADKQPIIATGRIRALTTPLTAPLSGTPCVGYQYRMYYTVPGSEGGTLPVLVYWGSGARPFALHSPSSLVRVVAVPLMSHAGDILSGATAVERARGWIGTTRFELSAANPLGSMGAAFAMIRDVLTDEDGEVRHDWKREGDERDPATLILHETVLPVDAAASVHGTWSSARAAIAADGGAYAPAATIVLGPPEALKGTVGAPQSVLAYVAMAIAMMALGAGLLWLGPRM